MLEKLRQYNVIWDSPSADASGSMPIGNGDFGLNVWVEAGGDLLLLLGKTDAWDENSTNLKLGRLRVKLEPNPFAAGKAFRQELKLETGEIVIQAGDVALRIWVDANHAVAWIEVDAEQPVAMTATVESWRRKPYVIKTQTGDLFKNLTGPDPYPTVVSPDTVFEPSDNRLMWCHHNEQREHDGFEVNMRLQGLGGMLGKMQHPLLHRTFGAAMEGEGFEATDDATLASPARRQHRLTVYALTMHPATVEQWRTEIEEMISQGAGADARKKHEAWWREFWERSWIFVEGDQAARDVTRGYILQRFMNACGGRGAQPIKFNGSIFTVGTPEDPDFRRWGGPGFWFQNQRLIYWPMLASGDFYLMLPWLQMYRDQLELQRHRTKTYFGHGGAHYPETIMFWGAEVSGHYGWTPFEKRERPEAECAYLTYYWSGGIELTLMMWAYWRYTGDADFLKEYLLPVADAVMEFFDLHYPRDEKGKIRFEPAQSLETWHWAINPTPEIAGLQYTIDRLLELPVGGDLRRRWERMLDELPEIPVGEKDGKRVILPAEQVDRKKNTENPELYAIFPYRLFGVGKRDLEMARDTFNARLHPSHDCWSQDDIQMALLGMTAEAKEWISKRASDASHSASRFPAFWDAFHDWLPDMDHGGVLQMALQCMLMQFEGEEVVMLPAWPREWEADFKLHVPDERVLSGRVKGGRVQVD